MKILKSLPKSVNSPGDESTNDQSSNSIGIPRPAAHIFFEGKLAFGSDDGLNPFKKPSPKYNL